MNCEVKYCLRDAAYGRKKCETCRARIRREKYPVKQAYLQIKLNARKRGIKFSLTLEYWQRFCKATNYIKLRGRESMMMSIDRIDINRGYADDNIQMLTKSQNSIKKHKEDRRGFKSSTYDDVPF